MISGLLWYADPRRQVWFTLALSERESASQTPLSQLALTSKHLANYVCKNTQLKWPGQARRPLPA